MPSALPTQRGIDPAATTPLSAVDAMLRLSPRTLSWLAGRAPARLVVDSVWDTLTELNEPVTTRACSPRCGLCSSTTNPPAQAVAAPAAG